MRRLFRHLAVSDEEWHMRKKRIRRIQLWLLLLAFVLTMANIFVELKLRAQRAHPEPAARAQRITRASAEEITRVVNAVKEAAADFHVDPKTIRQKNGSYIVPIPKEMRFLDFYFHLKNRLSNIDAGIGQTIDDRKKSSIEMTVLIDEEFAVKLVFLRKQALPSVAGRIAIVIDDFGYSYNEVVKDFLFFPEPLTVSIIPGLEESGRIAKEAQLAEREIMVHLPMEPLNENYANDDYIILAIHDRAMVRLRVRQAFSQIPQAVGLNNHQGSKVTMDRKIMTAVMTEIKNEKKFFIDSHTSRQSVALAVAHSLKVPAAANQIFLDAEDDETFIETQLLRLAELSCKQGKAVGIAHVRKRTFDVLQRMIPELKSRGIEFVYVTEIL